MYHIEVENARKTGNIFALRKLRKVKSFEITSQANYFRTNPPSNK